MSGVTTKYDKTTRYLHWVSAMVILWASITGFYTLFMEDGSKLKADIAYFNVSLTTVFIPIFLYRVFHRLKHQAPSYSSALSAKEIQFAARAHQFMYITVLVVLFSGVLMMPQDIEVFYVLSLPHLINNESVLSIFKVIHTYSTTVLGVSIVLHLLAVVKHSLNGKRIFRRMV